VQTALGYNNKQLQDNAESLEFTATTVTEYSWICDTSFILSGYSGTVSEESEGPSLGSCPTGWTAGEISETVDPDAGCSSTASSSSSRHTRAHKRTKEAAVTVTHQGATIAILGGGMLVDKAQALPLKGEATPL
jgi:hypothetical protein